MHHWNFNVYGDYTVLSPTLILSIWKAGDFKLLKINSPRIPTLNYRIPLYYYNVGEARHEEHFFWTLEEFASFIIIHWKFSSFSSLRITKLWLWHREKCEIKRCRTSYFILFYHPRREKRGRFLLCFCFVFVLIVLGFLFLGFFLGGEIGCIVMTRIYYVPPSTPCFKKPYPLVIGTEFGYRPKHVLQTLTHAKDSFYYFLTPSRV